MQDRVAPLLLDWYERHARPLPWRKPPHALLGSAPPDPYRVWLSEVMLQQTTVAAVAPYFEKFLARWPTVQDLAAASEADILAEWAGLGYYSRARNLVKCARQVAEMGGFPETEEALRELPGLGSYSAAAIAAIAFGKRAVVIDANVERVVARLFAIDTPLPTARRTIRERADAITPAERSGDFAQAMMDLGASLCRARDAKCLLCPLSQFCGGRNSGDPLRLPVKAPKKPKPRRQGTAFWIERQNGKQRDVWLVTRPGRGLLGGMRALPDDGWSAGQNGSGDAPVSGAWRAGGVVQHGFTHFDLELGVAVHAGRQERPSGEGEWWPVAQLEDAGLPTLFAKAADLVLAARN